MSIKSYFQQLKSKIFQFGVAVLEDGHEVEVTGDLTSGEASITIEVDDVKQPLPQGDYVIIENETKYKIMVDENGIITEVEELPKEEEKPIDEPIAEPESSVEEDIATSETSKNEMESDKQELESEVIEKTEQTLPSYITVEDFRKEMDALVLSIAELRSSFSTVNESFSKIKETTEKFKNEKSLVNEANFTKEIKNTPKNYDGLSANQRRLLS